MFRLCHFIFRDFALDASASACYAGGVIPEPDREAYGAAPWQRRGGEGGMWLYRVPTLLPLVTAGGVICGWEGSVWGWAAALAAIIVAHTLQLRRITLCCVLVAGALMSTQNLRTKSAEQMRDFCSMGRAVKMSGTIVREVGSSCCILETGWAGARVALRGKIPWRVGDKLHVVAEPLPIEEAPVQGMFSTAEWMRQQSLCANLAYLHGEKIGTSLGWSLLVRWAGSTRSALADILMPPGTERDARRQVLCALLLGDKGRSDPEVTDVFRRSGSLHAFAVSGLHVGLVAGMLLGLLKLCRVPPRAAHYAMLAGVGFYVFATGLSVPAIRAYLMLAAVMGGLILRRRSNMLNTWCFVAMIILLIEPWQLFQPGYQLSFVVYAAICLGIRYGMRDEPWFGPDALLPPRLYSVWDRILVRVELFMRGTFVVSLVAWMVSLPFSITQFHAVSALSYLTNIAITPLLPLVMLAGLLSLLLAPVPLLGSACQYLALKGAGWLVSLVSFISLSTGSYVPACKPLPPCSGMVMSLPYGRSFCVMGNPGVLIGDVRRESDARYTIEPALFHAGYSPRLIWTGPGDAAAALALYRRSWPQLRLVQQEQRSVHRRSYVGISGEFRFYFPPPRLPLLTAAHAQPIVLWLRPDGMRVLYLGHAAASTLESIPPEDLRADVILIGCHPNEPILDAEALRAMSPSRIIKLPSEKHWEIPDSELAPAQVERLSADERPMLLL